MKTSLPQKGAHPLLSDQHTDGGHLPPDPHPHQAVVEVIACQPMVEHVAEHDAVLGQGKERVDKWLTVLVVSPVEI